MWRALLATAFFALAAPAYAQSEQLLRDCAECPELVVIPPGQFMAGSPETERDRHPDEAAPHTIMIERAFAIGRYEVTAEEWDACVAASACRASNDWGYGRGRQPVLDVSWDDAQSYVAWLNTRVPGGGYRLPTEVEWEYAARARTQTRYAWGDQGSSCDEGAANGANSDVCEPSRPQPVGRYGPNGFGLYDMSGNVWEWTADCYWPADPCRWRALRGGSWGNPIQDMRVANRAPNEPSYRSIVVGFRIAKDIP